MRESESERGRESKSERVCVRKRERGEIKSQAQKGTKTKCLPFTFCPAPIFFAQKCQF